MSPYHTTSALYPVIQRLSWIAGLASGDDLAARAEKLDRLLAYYGEDAAECGAIYATLLSLDLGDGFDLPGLSAQQRKEITLDNASSIVRSSQQRGGRCCSSSKTRTGLTPSTSELLREIVLRIHLAPICVVVTHRPEWSADWASDLSQVTGLTIGRLTKQQMRELIELKLDAVSDQLVDRIAARTDGVPLFVEELTRSILESGKDASDDVHIPDSLQGSLMARLDRLPAPSKEVAQIASVIGREFDRGLLAQVVAFDGPVLDGALRQLVAAQLVVMVGTSQQSLLFRHALIQDTAYQSLLSRKRRQYHQAIADAMVKSYPNLLTTQPELVARHYTEAQSEDLALPYWTRAGERALERSANYEAVDHFSNAPPSPSSCLKASSAIGRHSRHGSS